MEFKDLVQLGKVIVNANPSSKTAYSFGNENFSYEDLNTTFEKEIDEMVGDYYKYEANKVKYFQLMAEIITDYLPKKVMAQYGQFAEVKTYAQGTKPIFTQKITEASKRRAKQFITKAGLAGIYEVFRLDGQKLEVVTNAYGAACQVTLEEFLDGRMSLQDTLDIVMQGLDDKVYEEIQKALIASVSSFQATNKATVAGWNEATFDSLMGIADSYGQSTIYCTYEFAAKMIPATGWVSNEMKNEKWNNGYLGNYKGHRVIVLEQSYTDETNTTKVVNPGYVWIIPTGAEKPIKVAFEGSAIVDEYVNYDRSKEIQIYQKFGVGAMIKNNMCVYIDSTLVA